LQKNRHKNTIFIVDEASMISDFQEGKSHFGGESLLDDLISYVYSGQNCRLILVGDTAQLPPVKMELSPALKPEKLGLNYQKQVDHIELTAVVRQQLESGILANATLLRQHIKQGLFEHFKFDNTIGHDLIRLVDGYEL